MKKIFVILSIAAILLGCSKEEIMPTTGKYTLTGYSVPQTKTDFGTPGVTSIPFVWSEGDKIWSGSEQSNPAVINPNGSAVFSFSSEPSNVVYYNMSGTTALEGNVLVEQSIDNSLGLNGDYGYATVTDGSFTLNHATSYLWFDVVTEIGNTKLQWIKVDANDVDIAGKSTWNSTSFGEINDGSSIVKLNIGQTISSTNDNVWAMVVFPVDLTGKSVKITYKLTVGEENKYFTQTLVGKQLHPGKTQKISVNITEAELADYAELRVLTFEDGSEKFDAFTINSYYHDTYGSNDYEISEEYEIKKWSNLIPQMQKCDPLNYGAYDPGVYYDIWSAPLKTDYYWFDDNNTFLKHDLMELETDLDWDGIPDVICRTYRSGGQVISNFKTAVTDTPVPDGYEQDWSEVMLSLPIDAKSGSNFCVHNGYSQDESSMHSFYFGDGIARVVDHMYVTNTSYVLHSLVYGDGFNSAAQIGTTWFKITAIGYNGSTKTGSVDFMLCDLTDGIVDDWQKFDLYPLGKVTTIKFTLSASEDQCGGYGMNTPGYFAYDDVAVRIEE